MTDWIYCSEKLPPYGQFVLLSRCSGGLLDVLIGVRRFTDKEGEHFFDLSSNDEAKGIYAWMPIPKPAVLR